MSDIGQQTGPIRQTVQVKQSSGHTGRAGREVQAIPARRRVLCGIALLGLGVPAAAILTSCSSDAGDAATTADPTGATSGTGRTGSSASPSAGAAGPTGSTGSVLVQVSEVPVGGGIVVDGPDGKIVVVQPTSGDIKAYDAACPHQGTTVDPPVDGILRCPNHGSRFKASDGSVTQGPARTGLTPITVSVSVSGGTVQLA